MASLVDASEVIETIGKERDAALAEVERLKLESARRELDDAVPAAAHEILERLGLDPNSTELSDAVLAAAHEMLERLGLDPNGTELSDMADERKEGGA